MNKENIYTEENIELLLNEIKHLTGIDGTIYLFILRCSSYSINIDDTISNGNFYIIYQPSLLLEFEFENRYGSDKYTDDKAVVVKN